MGDMAPFWLWKPWESVGAGKRQRYGDFSKSTGMSLLCTVFPALTAALFSINRIRWILRFPCLSRQNSCVFLTKYVFGCYNQMIEKIKMESRRYAKRQLTWFRRNKSIHWLDASLGNERNTEIILKEIRWRNYRKEEFEK